MKLYKLGMWTCKMYMCFFQLLLFLIAVFLVFHQKFDRQLIFDVGFDKIVFTHDFSLNYILFCFNLFDAFIARYSRWRKLNVCR